MYPLLTIDLAKLEANMRVITERCRSYSLDVFGVTKVARGDPRVGQALVAGGAVGLADSRLDNLARLREAELGVPLMLLRTPSLTEVERVIETADISVNSEKPVLEALSRTAAARGHVHRVLLMVDLGDLREGVWGRELFSIFQFASSLPNIEVWGIGTNLACLSGASPTPNQYKRLVELLSELAVPNLVVSGGNSSALHLMRQEMWCGEWTSFVSHLRIGESAFLGWDIIDHTPLWGCYRDVCLLTAEVIEVQTKPTAKGLRRRAVLAVGRQDIGAGHLQPVEPGVEVVGVTSDHMVADVEGAPWATVGGLLSFTPDYDALLGLFTSPYVEKKHIVNIAVQEIL